MDFSGRLLISELNGLTPFPSLGIQARSIGVFHQGVGIDHWYLSLYGVSSILANGSNSSMGLGWILENGSTKNGLGSNK